jgi:protease IV
MFGVPGTAQLSASGRESFGVRAFRRHLEFAPSALAAIAVLSFAAPTAAQSVFDAMPYAMTSVAATDDAAGYFVNPALAGVRHSGGYAFIYTEKAGDREAWYRGVISGPNVAAQAAMVDGGKLAWGTSAAGGKSRFRLGTTWTSLNTSVYEAGLPFDAVPEARTDDRTGDWRVGFMSRSRPWLSMGGVLDHAMQPKLGGAVLRREYIAGIGIRPLAGARGSAHTLGTRLTVTGDMAWSEAGKLNDPRWRVGGELELAQGVALQGAFGRDGEVRFGVQLLGGHFGLGAHRAEFDEGPARNTYTALITGSENRTTLDPRHRVAVVRAGGTLGDDAVAGFSIFGADTRTPSKPLHQQLERALEDPQTRGVLLHLTGISGMAQVEELRPRIRELRAAGKPVVAYLEYGGRRADLYLAAACDRIVTPPEAFFAGLGLHAETRYYRQALADWGVRIDRASYGRYKSAYRNFSVDSTSDADRESVERVLDVAQDLFVTSVSADRGIPPSQLMTVLDGRSWRSSDLVQLEVIDAVGYRDDALRMLGELAEMRGKPRAVDLRTVRAERREWVVPTRLAVVYASGGVESGTSGNDLLVGPFVGSSTLSRQIEAAYRNPEVEAVVLRVDSPGGASIAADHIYHALDRMKRETGKPLVVSMGSVAASGGYHISLPADRIFADRFTRTGSIGVLTVRYSFEGWNREHNVHQEDFDRGDYMRYWSTGHDWDARAQAAADSAVRREHDEFVALVAARRGMPVAAIDSVAQGRVWMGEDARERGLVDEIGGLEAAMADARQRAGIPTEEKIEPKEYRRPRPALLDRLVGGWMRGAMERALHMPEPGAWLHWLDPRSVAVE